MSIELDPVELGFKRPFNQEIEERLRLKNPNSSPVLFKVKTTAPKQYCVRPNCGRIEPGENVEVAVLLQAMKEDPPLDAKCRDKFLVQSTTISPEQEITNVAQQWSSIESSTKVMEKKIRVSFLPADGPTVGPAVTNNTQTPARQSMTNHDEQPPAYSSPVSNMATPATASKAETNGTASRDVTESSSNTATTAAAAGGAGAVAGGTLAAISSSIPQSSEDVKAQLEKAKAEIADLQRQLQDPVLRQRKVDAAVQGTKDKVNAGVTAIQQQEVPGGVAVPIVAALCLLSFLIAYILF